MTSSPVFNLETAFKTKAINFLNYTHVNDTMQDFLHNSLYGTL